MSRTTPKKLRNLFIYQVYVRNYTNEGTFKSVEKDLSRIKEMDVDYVYLLPIHPIGEINRKGELGSPYSIQDYYGINPELGTLEDFKSLINAVHSMGMKLMMDVVFNHTSYDSVLIQEHPEYFYTKDGKFTNRVGDWWDITDLDYTKDKGLWTYLIDVVLYWSRLGVDGFRFDVASLLPIDFLKQLIERVKEEKPETLFVSESVHGGFCRYLRNQGIACLSESEIFQVFDMAYDYDIHPYFEGYLKGETSFKRYLEALTLQEEIYPENYIKMRNLENHDYGRFAKMVNNNIDQIKQWLALNFFSKGSTMIYAGQEFCDDHLPDLFNKDVVHWDGYDLSQYIKQLNILTNQDICAYGAYDIDINDQEVFVGKYTFKDHQMIGIFNIGLISGSIQVDLKDGRYTNDINGEKVVVKDGKIPCISEPILIQL
jgi:glycosidase